MNWKKVFKIRASAISQIMSNPMWWSPLDKYNKKLKELETEQSKYEAITNKETKTAQKKWDKILKIWDDISELKQEKDKIVLSKTCITHLEQRIKENYFWRRKQLDTKAIQKGIECETEAVFILNKVTWKDYKKAVYNNWERLENDRCTGHEDIDDKENKKTIDTKVSASFDSFPIIKDQLEQAYYRQWQWYMRLKGEEYKKHEVVKVLVNTPARQIKSLLYNCYMQLSKKYEATPEYLEEEYKKKSKQIFLWHVFDKQLKIESNWEYLELKDEEIIPYEKRIHIFEVNRNDEDIEKIIKRVEECRVWLNQNGY